MTGEELDKINCRTGIYCNRLNRDIENITNKSKIKGEKNLLIKSLIPIPEQYYDNLIPDNTNNNIILKVINNQTIGCYTLLNTYNKMNCADITIDGSIIVVGFKDGIIKLWINNPDIITEINDTLLKQMEYYTEKENGNFNYNKFLNIRKGRPIENTNNNITDNTITNININNEDKNVYDEIISKQRVFKLTGHSDSVFSISISYDKKYIISGSYDETIRLWSIFTKACIIC
jgi:WD40 repeat protein